MATIDIKLKSYDELTFEITKLNTDLYLKDKEIQRLNKLRNEDNEKAAKIIMKMTTEIDRQNNIIDELEKWLIDVDIFQMNFIENKEHITPYKAVIDKLKELKEKE